MIRLAAPVVSERGLPSVIEVAIEVAVARSESVKTMLIYNTDTSASMMTRTLLPGLRLLR